ncbi:MAG TPA: ornithine carbamoyltransferase [Clostridia bacterium]|nr:ornithine carbamoyltransferase [Clostridia bacterium]
MSKSSVGESPMCAPAGAQVPFVSRDLISISDFSPAEVKAVLDLTALMKARPEDFRGVLSGKQIAMFFEKPSLRTRITFEAGIASMGGTSFFVDQTRSRLAAREPLSDIAHNLERWIHGIVLRTFDHETVSGIAKYASVPVVNALSDYEHPCQALADFFTLQEKFVDLRTVKLAYVGDGNNVAHSLMLAAASLGSHIAVATPAGYEPAQVVTKQAREIAALTGATIEVTNDARHAATGADAVYTDVWASMGQEEESAERSKIFAPFQVNAELFSLTSPNAIFMHCLPAHRGDEVTDAVIDSPSSVVFDQAENRLHIQKAILLVLLGGGMRRFPPIESREFSAGQRSAHA